MAAQTGRTNEIFVQTWIDNTGGTLTNLSAYLKSVGDYGLKFDEQDVTGVSDAIKNMTLGRPEAPLTLTWQVDTVIFAHLISLVNRRVPLSLDIRQGIQQSQVTGEPCFGISSSATSGYILTSFMASATEYKTTWAVVGSVAPDFAVTNHT